jgi:hypothetical protein
MNESQATDSLNYTLKHFQEKGYEIKEIKYRTDFRPSKSAFPDVYITSMILYDDKEKVKVKSSKQTHSPSLQGVS